jgi:hypothetical protein
MTRRHRVALVVICLASSLGVVSLLTRLGTASEGPMTTALERLGTLVGSVEHEIRQRFGRGASRAQSLAWFRPYREDASRLRLPDTVLLGVYDGGLPNTLDGVTAFEQQIGTTVPLVQLYSAWGDKPDQVFPLHLATAIWDMGSVPVITWEPWLTDFENARHPLLPLRAARERHGMAAVARGEYDFYIDAWAVEAARYARPLFVRFAHEMNDPYRYPWGPQNNTKEEYIAAWRHVRERFVAARATNVIWVWSPHVAYEYWDLYYPGNDVVDWVATGALNFGSVARWSQWWTFDEIFGSKYAKLAAFGKPVIVAEFGSLSVGGDRKAWYRDALADLPSRYPGVKALIFFHATRDATMTYQTLDWSIDSEATLAPTIAAAIRPWSPGHIAQTPVDSRKTP